MTNRTVKTHVPGEPPKSTDEGKDLGITADQQQNFPGDLKAGVEVPEGFTFEQMAQTVLILQQQLAATNSKMAAMTAAGEHLPTSAAPKLFTEAEAKRMCEAQIAAGEPPTPVLTAHGVYVHDKSFSSAEQIDEHNDKAAAKAARKAKAD